MDINCSLSHLVDGWLCRLFTWSDVFVCLSFFLSTKLIKWSSLYILLFWTCNLFWTHTSFELKYLLFQLKILCNSDTSFSSQAIKQWSYIAIRKLLFDKEAHLLGSLDFITLIVIIKKIRKNRMKSVKKTRKVRLKTIEKLYKLVFGHVLKYIEQIYDTSMTFTHCKVSFEH